MWEGQAAIDIPYYQPASKNANVSGVPAGDWVSDFWG